MTSADVIRAHSYGVQVEADARQPRQRGTIPHVAEANFTSMRKQMEAANRSIAVDLDYQTQRAASAEKQAARLQMRLHGWQIVAGALAGAVIGLAVTLWGMSR